MAKRIITVHIEDSILEELDKWAERSDRSRNWCINQAIAMLLEEDAKLTFQLQKAGKR